MVGAVTPASQSGSGPCQWSGQRKGDVQVSRRQPSPTDAAALIGAGRIGLAALFFTAPVGGVRALGTDTATARRVSWMTRMMAARDGVLGLGTVLAARRGADPVPWVLAGAACDAVDAAAMAGALRQRRIRGLVPTASVPIAVLAAGAGFATAVGLRRG